MRARAQVSLAPEALQRVARAADFLAEKVAAEEPIYGVNTGFGSNADKLLGAHRVRDELPGGNPDPNDRTLMEELQHNLIITHAVCVGEPFPGSVVRAMLGIRINTLLRGHSGIRVSTLEALAAMLNRGVIVPVIPARARSAQSGDLAPLSHLAIVLLGGGEAFHQGERVPGAEALRRAGIAPVRLSFKEGLALNNGTAQMLAWACWPWIASNACSDTADLAAAMTSGSLRRSLRCLASGSARCVRIRGRSRPRPQHAQLLDGSTLIDIPYHLVPRFKTWNAARGPSRRIRRCASTSAGTGCREPAPRPREVLPALPAVQGRQEASAAGQPIACVACRRCTARCAMPGAGRRASSTSN
jgi:histidine ammonia-lyase